jgi:hypothetical protein
MPLVLFDKKFSGRGRARGPIMKAIRAGPRLAAALAPAHDVTKMRRRNALQMISARGLDQNDLARFGVLREEAGGGVSCRKGQSRSPTSAR